MRPKLRQMMLKALETNVWRVAVEEDTTETEM
jgi:hypothetical protein